MLSNWKKIGADASSARSLLQLLVGRGRVAQIKSGKMCLGGVEA